MENFSKRLKILIGERRQKEFAEWIGQSPTRLNNYLSGTNQLPAADFLYALAKRGINVNWLLTGEGEMYLSSKRSDPLPPEIQSLLFEIGDDRELALELLALARSSKNVQQAYSVVAERLAEFKASFRKKKK
jgi:transcriptional regulator with XRE-family HTH domain